MYACSYGDNLKVTLPDEFDLVFHIKFPENDLVTVEEDECLPGNVHLNITRVLHKIRNEKQHSERIPYLRRWTDENGYILINKLQSYFESCFHKTLQRMNYTAYINGRYASLRYRKEGPAHTIHVTDIDIDNRYIRYSVDFVPGILLKESQSVMPTHVGEWEAIPKPIKNINFDHTSFRSSFYRQEKQLIQNKKNLKNTLRLMKKFRDAHLNINNMKSYFIKTLFLWKAQEQSETNYWHKSLSVIIIDMFKEFEDSLLRRNLEFFWNPELNLYKEFSDRQFREILGTVQSARNILENAARGLSLSLQRRTYAIFLELAERQQFVDWQVQNYEPQDHEPEKEVGQQNSESYCVIL